MLSARGFLEVEAGRLDAAEAAPRFVREAIALNEPIGKGRAVGAAHSVTRLVERTYRRKCLYPSLRSCVDIGG
ncbi:MAG TPA: hypothetical protein VF215_00730 [Thermoanaerobaculia bacterium]